MTIFARQTPGAPTDNGSKHTHSVADLMADSRPPSNLPTPLTARELEVLALVAEGHSNKAIGLQLGISERTVKSHLTYIMAKLRTSDRTHAVVTAVRLGWLDI